MAPPITWRNVDAPDLRGAASMLQLASNGINSGFDKLNQVLQNEQATADANWKVQRDNNTQAFLNSINQYRTPEEYQTALVSGALDPGKYGAQIDQAVVRSALDGRLAILQDRAIKANQFEDQQKAREAQPIVDRLNTMALSDDKQVRQSAKEALGIYAQNGMVPEASKIAGNIRNVEHQNVTWDQEAKKVADDLLTNAARRNLFGAQAAEAAADTRYKNSLTDAGFMPGQGKGKGGKSDSENNPNAVGKLDDSIYKAALKGTVYADGSYDPRSDNSELYKTLKERMGEDKANLFLNNVRAIAEKNKVVLKDDQGNVRIDPATKQPMTAYLPIPTTAILRATDSSYGKGLFDVFETGKWLGKEHNASAFSKALEADLAANGNDYSSQYGQLERARGNAIYPGLVQQQTKADVIRGLMAGDVSLNDLNTSLSSKKKVSK